MLIEIYLFACGKIIPIGKLKKGKNVTVGHAIGFEIEIFKAGFEIVTPPDKRKVVRETIDTLNAVQKVLRMDIKSFIKDTNKISKIATVIIFLALIRTICEPFRLQYYSSISLT